MRALKPALRNKAGQPALAPAPKRNPPPPPKRQSGAPNLFGLRRSSGTRKSATSADGTINTARVPLIAAGMILLAFILAAMRFEQMAVTQPQGASIGQIAVSPSQQLLVILEDQILLHNRAGLPTRQIASSDLGISENATVVYLDQETILSQSQTPAAADTLLSSPLLRCQLNTRQCEPLLRSVGRSSFAVANEQIFIADGDRDKLHKLKIDGSEIATAPLALTAPKRLLLQEGILYLVQNGSQVLTIIKPDDQGFGTVLDSVALDSGDALATEHRYPRDLVYLNERWWALLSNEDFSSAGLYLFNLRFRLDRRIELPPSARPDALVVWNDKVLVRDSHGGIILRFDNTGAALKAFTSEALSEGLSAGDRERTLTHWLQVLVLVSLVLLIVGLLILAGLQSLRIRVFTPPEQPSEARLDIHSEFITWLEPAAELRQRAIRLGSLLAAIAVLCLLLGIITDISSAGILSLFLLLIGSAGLYHALIRSTRCHLGMVRDHLILVDHHNTYRVGSGPRIQYLGNFVMVDDVLVYLGNRLLAPFSMAPLQQIFQPLIATGIKVDQATLHVKLLQQRHPLVLGLGGFVVCGVAAVTIMLLG
ncbi:hypothetical protein [Candidatus Litorirhabdus singularis]|uniref:hypothetical protein n=1 Tax=Candidatus Litorirhabdus singularis TaxID=2518993 RepID=UPI00242BFB42|nr:hypothetical protein [Candidatus Litorirhabdus singularis]